MRIVKGRNCSFTGSHACYPHRNDNFGGEGKVLPPILFWLTLIFLVAQKGMQKFKIVAKPLLEEKYVHGRKKKKVQWPLRSHQLKRDRNQNLHDDHNRAITELFLVILLLILMVVGMKGRLVVEIVLSSSPGSGVQRAHSGQYLEGGQI